MVGLTTANTLITFDSNSPGTVSAAVPIQGLIAAENVVGIDVRPATGQLYGVVTNSTGGGNNARLVIIDPTTGQTSAVGTGSTFALSGTNVGVDFNPVPDRLRITTDAGQSLRVNPDTGALAGTDTAPFFDPTNDVNNGFTNPAFFDTDADGDNDPSTNPPTLPTNLQITAAAYTTDTDPTNNNAAVTTLYGIDTADGLLVRIGGANGTNPDGTTNSPNNGQTFAVDYLRDTTTFAAVTIAPQNGFDIDPVTRMGYLVAAAGGTGSTLYSVDVTSAAVTTAGPIGGGVALRGLAVAAPTTGAGTVQLVGTALTFPADRSRPLAVTLTRTGGSTGTVTVDYATADGTAVGGRDYLPAAGTVTFQPGQTTQQIFLLRPSTATPGPAPDRSLSLTLSNPTGGVTLAASPSATVTIPAVAATTTSGRRFAAGQASGDSQVAVYDAVSGQLAFTFTPFAGSTAGVRVASGDVTGDGVDDVIVAGGSGAGPRVSVFDGATLTASNQTAVANFFAYESTFTGGVYVAAGDVNGDGFADVLIGAGLGGGPRVRVIDGATITSDTQTVVADFFAYEPTFRGGVFVAAGSFDGDAFDDIVTGASVGGGPRVQIFSGASILPAGTGTGAGAGTGSFASQAATGTGAVPTILANYFAYDSSFRDGVFVATGDVNGDGTTDVVTGPGSGGGSHVRSFSGATNTVIGEFLAFDATLRSGAPVATADLNADGRDEILVGYGVGDSSGGANGTGTGTGTSTAGAGTIRVFDATGAAAADPLQPFGAFTGGVFVG